MSSEALVSILNPRKLKRQHELHDVMEAKLYFNYSALIMSLRNVKHSERWKTKMIPYSSRGEVGRSDIISSLRSFDMKFQTLSTLLYKQLPVSYSWG